MALGVGVLGSVVLAGVRVDSANDPIVPAGSSPDNSPIRSGKAAARKRLVLMMTVLRLLYGEDMFRPWAT